MSGSRPTLRKRAPPPGKRWAEWALVRARLAIYAFAADWLIACTPSRLCTDGLRRIARDIDKLEQILRCLLLLMHPPRKVPKPAVPVFTTTSTARSPRRRRAPARLSITLRKFSWYTPPARPAPHSVAGSSPRLRLPAEDPAAALRRRLAALRAVFTDPAPHARRIADAWLARGLRPRRPESIFPNAELWQFLRWPVPTRTPASLSVQLDSS